MDLGATVCTPTKPNCLICPVSDLCAARAEGEPERYPIKPAKVAKPVRYGTAYVLRVKDQVLLVRRPDKGLLGGMLALPTEDWVEGGFAETRPPATAEWEDIGEVRHVFTHFALRFRVMRAEAARKPKIPGAIWTNANAVKGLPSVFEKAYKLALK